MNDLNDDIVVDAPLTIDNGIPQFKHTPRNFQLELFDHAKENNSILVLGTGSGKTFIGIMLLQHFGDEIRGKFSEGAKRTIMIANTVPLVKQQADAIRTHTGFEVRAYDGSMGVDFWKEDEWQKELEETEVMVMVAEIFKIMLYHKYISISQVNLLIIDECHHATGNHPMREVMRYYASVKENNRTAKLPRILGLTASVIQKKCKDHQVEKMLKELEVCLDSRLITSSNYEEVLAYTTKPQEVLIGYDNSLKPRSQHYKSITQKLGVHLERLVVDKFDSDQVKTSKKKVLRVLRNILSCIEDLGEWCASRAIEYESEHFKDIMEEETFSEMVDMINSVSETLDTIKVTCREVEKQSTDIEQNLSHHAERLLTLVRKTVKDGQDMCGLIFVKERCVARLISKLLNHLAKSGKDPQLLSKSLVGSSNAVRFGDLAASTAELRKQNKILQDFKNRKFRFIVATNVLEEGVDVQACNLVIRFNEPDNFRSYVQGKGRARAKESFYFMMKTRSSKLDEDVLFYQSLEKKLHSLCHQRSLPLPEEIFEAFQDDPLPPYAPYGKDGPQITSSSCLSLVSNYCSRLPQDKFTILKCHLNVRKFSENEETVYVAGVTLPTSCPIKHTVEGDPMVNKDWAKRSAMLKVAQLLHEKGELNEKLMPYSKKSIEEVINKDIGYDAKHYDNKTKLHTKKVCQSFSHQPGNAIYWMYRITIQQKNENYVNVFEGKEQFTLLCGSEIYHCNFPLYHSRWKEAHVTLECVGPVKLSPDQYTLLDHFNSLIFRYMLKIDANSSVLELDRRASDYKILFAPMINRRINMALLNKLSDDDSLVPKRPSLEAQQKFEYNDSKYQNAVIVPWYKEDTAMLVRKITDVTPLSPFAGSEDITYKQYYQERYKVDIFDTSQKLLLCTHISEDLSMLFPHFRTGKQCSFNMVPELCHLVPLSYQLFYHMTCLPSILSRLNSLNNARDFMHELHLPIPLPRVAEPMDINWCRNCTNEIIASHPGSDNICIPLQKKDVISFGDYNSYLLPPNDRASAIEDFLVANSQLYGRPEYFMQTILCRHAKDYFDLERLEVLGDAFLKYHVGQVSFMVFPEHNEGHLTMIRSKLTSNKMLNDIGLRTGVDGILVHSKLNPVENGPAPGFVVPPQTERKLKELGLANNLWHKYKENQVFDEKMIGQSTCFNSWKYANFSDKNVADSIEAMLGWSLLSGSIVSTHRMLVALDLSTMNRPICVPTTALLPANNLQMQKDKLNLLYKKHCLDRLEQKIGYRFNDKSFLLQAMTHPSCRSNSVTDVYQRLEYLGDAVLDFLVTGYIFTVDDLSPGRMTDIRMHFVCNETLAHACIKKNLNKYLLHACSKLKTAIDKYITTISYEIQLDSSSSSNSSEENSDEEIYDDSGSVTAVEAHAPSNGLNLEQDSDCTLDDIEVPKVLGDLVESVIGAVYLDSKCSLDVTWTIVKKLIPDIVKDRSFEHVRIDNVRLMHEMFSNCMKLDFVPNPPKGKSKIMLQIPGFPTLYGIGKNKRLAKAAVAKLAVQKARERGMKI